MRAIALLLALTCLLPLAAAADVLTRAEAALGAGDLPGAQRLLAEAPVANPAQQARRDLLRANLLLAQGDPAAAIRIYDALISADPTEPVYRLALSRALLVVGQRDRARYHLMQLRGSNRLDRTERARLERVLVGLEGGRSREGWLRFAITPESNPGQRSDITSLSFGGLTLPIRGVRAQPETGLQFGIGGAVMPRIGPGLRLRLELDLDARLYRTSALNDLTLGGRIGLQGITAGGAGWDLAVSARQRWAGNQAYGRGFGVHGGWTQRVGDTAQLRLRLDLESWRHVARRDLDGPRQAVSVSWSQALRPDLMLRGTLFAHHNAARFADMAGQGVGVALGVQRVFPGGLMLGLDLTHQRSRRNAPDFLFGVVRRDRRSTLTARIMHRAVTVRGFAPALEIGLDRQKSTIPLHDFRNARVSVGFSREF